MKRVVLLLTALLLLSGVPYVHSQSTILHGFAYGPFREGQSPNLGIFPTSEQILQDMPLLKINGNVIRTYGCIKLEAIADHSGIAGITLAQGIWLDNIASDQSECEISSRQMIAVVAIEEIEPIPLNYRNPVLNTPVGGS